MKLKPAQEITTGDTFTDCAGTHTVAQVLAPLCTGSWDECRGTGFPRVLTTTGKVRLLVYGESYEILNP